jgi:A/G-specific adenine glycosylase
MAVEALLEWYRREARELPWRRTRDPYAILVSEVMLQQTQVARVLPRYEAWLARWPSAWALAAASRAEVLREWVGLGYNRRALALHAACAHVAEHGWPDDLRALPGVGPYTAAAVGAFAFGRAELPVDVNVRRVLARSQLRFEPVTPELGQALMDLGAVVCTARRPRCEGCPLFERCAAQGADVEVGRPPRARERFEESNRWVRGRIVAALVGAEPWPEVGEERLRVAVDGLVRDGVVVREADGGLALAFG